MMNSKLWKILFILALTASALVAGSQSFPSTVWKRIVKQTFLNIINNIHRKGDTIEKEGGYGTEPREYTFYPSEKEAWIKQVVKGSAGVILTKRPITASTEEEKLNSRCRSAKLRVIQKF